MLVTTNGAPMNTDTAYKTLWQDVSSQHPDALSQSPLTMQPWSPDTKEKHGKCFVQTRLSTGKRASQNNKLHWSTINQTWLAPNSGIMVWENLVPLTSNRSMTCLINESPSTLCPINKIEKIKPFKLVAKCITLIKQELAYSDPWQTGMAWQGNRARSHSMTNFPVKNLNSRLTY